MENIYHKLLGVSSEITAPNYYEILDIRPQNFTVEVLQQNYKQQLQKLQRLGNNPKYKEAILFLKSELRKARSQLENIESRNAYDAILQQKKIAELSQKIALFRIKGYIAPSEFRYLQKIAREEKIPQKQLSNLVGKTSKPKTHFKYKDVLYVFLLLGTLLFYNREYIFQWNDVTETKAKQKVKQQQKSFPDPSNIPPHMIYIPGGYFYMGYSEGNYDERPSRKVYLDAFYISKYEVTNADYYNFVKDTNYSIPYTKKRESIYQNFNWNPLTSKYPRGKKDHPVVLVSWEEANSYCKWLSQKLHLNVALPTEAQWEKAARGEAELSQYPWGPFAESDTFYANYSVHEDGFAQTAPVNSFVRGCSPFGCYNMSGNVAEWCLDDYNPTAYSTLKNTNPLYVNHNSQRKVVRGGSWENKIHQLRVSSRKYRAKNERNIHTGFRYVILISK
ncbi:formylglycine-generating enzyme family protein [Candidatus Uabimicrobium amorphum]|uniref:Protein 3-oxoalanine-generating enzyme familyprotein n=1 Tax=Uabimicrobium amorphum TaxID=2596890 RepID=A0A5S9F1D3_UABAM|nr:formylglycine-generating enzyme family protein [Candidatus Uabimicrobium amorphum]BBM82298.1 protein 3-oxoalanine-generating enzyme familyprotein [Candidatus Uabimicrobium amorphum]